MLDQRVYGDDAGAPPKERSLPGKAPEGVIYTVAAIGDSLTDVRTNGGKYVLYLQKRCPMSRFDIYGKGGEMVNQMRRRFGRDVLNDPPSPGKPRYSHVIIFGGVNDLYSDQTAGRTVEKITRDLGTMYDAAREHGIQVIAITVAPWGGFKRYFNAKRAAGTRRLNEWITEQGRTGRVRSVVDAYSLLSCGQPERLCDRYTKPFKDGIHFGPEGHERLGKALHEQAFSNCF